MIIVSIVGPGIKDALAQIARSSRYADLFEFRLDLIAEPFMSQLFAAARKGVIATCRPEYEGGAFEGSEEDRLDILDTASFLGAQYVDIEFAAGGTFLQEFLRRKKNSRLIVSHHQFDNKVKSVAALYTRMRKTGADVLKFAYRADDASDMRHAIKFLQLARRENQKAIAIAMGEYGEASRVLYKKFGGWATFASVDGAIEAAPGQIPMREMKTLYRADKVSPKTKVFGVVGNPLKQSKGIYLHNPLFQRVKKDAVYCRLQAKNIAGFMKHIAPILNGFSVTIPHKQAMMKFLDRLDPTAKAIGAVNTVVRRRGRLIGTNTDASGALDAIESKMRVSGKMMLVLGAGGAARAIAYEAQRRGATVFLANRTERKAKQLARELAPRGLAVNFIANAKLGTQHFDIIANATSLGMTPHVNISPLPKSMLKKRVVFDAVYNPPMTKFLRDAKSVGAEVIPGTEMYINQAALQSALYVGKKPSIALMKKIINIS